MALGLGRYYDVNPGTAYEHDGPGSSVVQVSHLPHSRPWLQTLAGGRSSQLNTARSSFWMDEKDALLDPSGLDQDHPTFNDVYVGSRSRGSRQLLGDDNDWYEANPSDVGQYTWSQADKALNEFLTNTDPNSPAYTMVANIILNQDLAAGINFLSEYINVYNTIGQRNVGDTNAIINESAQVELNYADPANVALLATYVQIAQDWTQNASTGIYSVGAALLENEGMPGSAYDFHTLVGQFNQLVAGQPAVISQLALNVVDQGTQLPNDPQWGAWPGVVDQKGNTVTLAPTLWNGKDQNPTDPVSITVQNQTTGLTFKYSGTVAQMAMNMAIFNAAMAVKAAWDNYYGSGSSIALPSAVTTPSTPHKPPKHWSLEEKIAVGAVGAGLLWLVSRQIVGA